MSIMQKPTSPPNRLSIGMYVLRTVLGLLFRRPLIGVRAIPVLADGRLVLVRSRRGGWVLPGGLMDLGEKFTTSLEREVLEECGMTVQRFGRLSGIYSDPLRDPRFHCICIVMEVFVEGEPGPRDIYEIEEAAFFRRDALPPDLAADCREHLEHYFAGRLIVD